MVDGLEKEGHYKFVKGVPEMNILDGGKKRTLLITDDIMSETDTRVILIFTKGSHHLNCSMIYISQNLFNKGKENRNIFLNTHFLVLFKNSRDSNQVEHLDRQISQCNKVLQRIFCRCDFNSIRLLADRPSNDDSRRLAVAYRHLL